MCLCGSSACDPGVRGVWHMVVADKGKAEGVGDYDGGVMVRVGVELEDMS